MSESILLVDDDPDDLVALERALEPLGLDLVTAGDGEEALRCLRGRDFALVVMDLMMPKMNGLEAARLIREREETRDLPILFLSGFDEEQIQALPGYAAVGAAVLTKPLRAEALIATVSQCLARRENAAR